MLLRNLPDGLASRGNGLSDRASYCETPVSLLTPPSPELEALPKRSRSRVGFLRVVGKIKYDTVSVLHIVRYSGVPLGPSYEP